MVALVRNQPCTNRNQAVTQNAVLDKFILRSKPAEEDKIMLAEAENVVHRMQSLCSLYGLQIKVFS